MSSATDMSVTAVPLQTLLLLRGFLLTTEKAREQVCQAQPTR